MPFIGKQPQVGAYSKLDAITTSATATYNLTLNSGAYYPSSANHLMVSLNGVMQAPQDSFTISGATIIFASTLASTDSIDFIMALGDVLDIGTPSDGTVVTAKMQDAAVTTAKIADANITTAKLASSLDLSGKTVTYGLTSSDLPAGSVLQIVSSIYTGSNDMSTTSTSYIDTQLSVAITPKFANSNILVQMIMNTQSPSGNRGESKIMRGSTLLTGYSWIGPNASHPIWGVNGGTWLDSPNTTSAITYKVQSKALSGLYYYHSGGLTSSLVLTEIKV